MPAVLAVPGLPVFRHPLGRGPGTKKQVDVQAFAAEPAAQGFDVAVPHGRPGGTDAKPTRSPAPSGPAADRIPLDGVSHGRQGLVSKVMLTWSVPDLHRTPTVSSKSL